MINVNDFRRMKRENKKIAMVTCYDYSFASLLNQTKVDCLLIGDSLAMTMYGFKNTIKATVDMLAMHTSAVARGAIEKFIIVDMPFLSFRKSIVETMNNVETLIQAGAHAVKIEGIEGNDQVISHIVKSGIPVMGHLGLTPQFIHQFGGFKVQGRKQELAKLILAEAKRVADSGCFALVLECIPASLASTITKLIDIPTIGIGAGNDVNGQVLVLQDLLGMNKDFKPKFVKHYCQGFDIIVNAINTYTKEVKSSCFPQKKHSYQGEYENACLQND